MKKIITVVLVLLPLMAWAQDKATQAFQIHEDRVKPSMTADYEKAAKALITALKDNNIEGVNWLAASTDDSRYLYVSKIDAMADLDKRPFAPLAEKIGAETIGKLFADLDRCYDHHGTYILNLDHELSYQPDGIDQNPEGQTYRRFLYLHASASNYGKLIENVKAHKTLSESKGSKWYYRVYRSGFGTMGSYLMVAIAAKNAVDFETRRQQMVDLLGSDRQKLMKETWENILKFESVTGQIRNDPSFSSQSN